MNNCKKHSSYKGLRPPTSNCKKCLDIYNTIVRRKAPKVKLCFISKANGIHGRDLIGL